MHAKNYEMYVADTIHTMRAARHLSLTGPFYVGGDLHDHDKY